MGIVAFSPEDLPDGSCFRRQLSLAPSGDMNYHLTEFTSAIRRIQYVGSFPVAGSDELTRSEIVKIQLSKLHEAREKGRPVLIVISVAGIKVCSPDGKTVYMAHALKRISYASCDPELSHFSFLAREPKGKVDLQFCHVFLAESPGQAEELNTIIGNAFRMAYAAQLQRKAPSFHEMISQQMHQHHENNRNSCSNGGPSPVSSSSSTTSNNADSSSPTNVPGNRIEEPKTTRVWAKNAIGKSNHREPVLDRLQQRARRDENCASWCGKGSPNQFTSPIASPTSSENGQLASAVNAVLLAAKSVPDSLNASVAGSSSSLPFLLETSEADRSHDNLSDLNSSNAESALLPHFDESSSASSAASSASLTLNNCQQRLAEKPSLVKSIGAVSISPAEEMLCQADCHGRFGGYVNGRGLRNGTDRPSSSNGCPRDSIFADIAAVVTDDEDDHRHRFGSCHCSSPVASNDLNNEASSVNSCKGSLRVKIPHGDQCSDASGCASSCSNVSSTELKCCNKDCEGQGESKPRAASRASCASSSTGTSSSTGGVAGSDCCSAHSGSGAFCAWGNGGAHSPQERSESLSPCEEENLKSAPWFQAGIPREIALEVLNEEPEGAFLVRESTTKKGCFALSLRVPKDFQPTGIAHYLIMKTQRGYKIKGFMKEFPCLTSLITHHSVMPELLPCPLSLARYNPSFTKTDSSKDFAELDADPDYNTLSDFRKMLSSNCEV